MDYTLKEFRSDTLRHDIRVVIGANFKLDDFEIFCQIHFNSNQALKELFYLQRHYSAETSEIEVEKFSSLIGSEVLAIVKTEVWYRLLESSCL